MKYQNKYHAVRSGGYDSRKEHRRACQLQMLRKSGHISNLREQVRFVLLPSQRDAAGKLIERECAYIADFVYQLPDGTTVVEDAKGYHTPEYIIKRKLMLYIHNIRIVEV